jgi:hypothetical protein
MSPNNKGWFHAALMVASVAEMFVSCTKTRKTLLGLCAGYHLHASIYHFVHEKEEPKKMFDLNDLARLRRLRGEEY